MSALGALPPFLAYLGLGFYLLWTSFHSASFEFVGNVFFGSALISYVFTMWVLGNGLLLALIFSSGPVIAGLVCHVLAERMAWTWASY